MGLEAGHCFLGGLFGSPVTAAGGEEAGCFDDGAHAEDGGGGEIVSDFGEDHAIF